MNNKTFDWNSRDPLFDEVAHYVVEQQAVSASAISDKFCIGTNRAERITKQLEQAHIIGDEDFDVEHVALKVDAQQSNYLRTLPLHHSQVEVERTEEYSIFEYRLCPSFDFRQKILSMGVAVEVLAPTKLIAKVREEGIAERAQPNEEYKFKMYKK